MPSTPRLSRVAAALLVLALSLVTRGASAQGGGTGEIRGRAYAASGRAPISYALIRLSPAAGGPGRSVLSDAEGVFLFAAVAPGTYRLSLERIGYASEVSEPFAVAAGEVVERNLASHPTAIALEPLVASPECRTAADLDRNPRLAAAWREALKGIETTRAFADGYVYSYEQRQYWSPDRDEAWIDTMVSRVVNDPRVPRPPRDAQGWGRASALTLRLELPEGREILDPAFLVTHCLEGATAQTREGFELAFRPVRPRRGRIDIRGVVRVDRRTLQVTELELTYLDGGRPFIEAIVAYQDATVPGGTVRVPGAMRFSGRPPRDTYLGPVRGVVEFVNYGDLMKAVPATPSP
jgi:hypothetical protein